MILGRIICWAKGHRRGHYFSDTPTHKVYRCPRCHATWTRKAKPKPEQSSGAPTDGSARYSVQEAI